MKWRVEGSCISLEQRCSSNKVWSLTQEGRQRCSTHDFSPTGLLVVPRGRAQSTSPLLSATSHLKERVSSRGPRLSYQGEVWLMQLLSSLFTTLNKWVWSFKRLVRSIRFSSSHLGGLGWSKSLLSNQILNALALVNKESNWNTTCG